MQNNSVSHRFRVQDKQFIKDIDAEVITYTHEQSGGTVVWIKNDDQNRSFGIGFLTPPKDSTGVAHIVEHSVLSGSRKYPVKDPFMYMMKTSMQTFLNALTFSDMTVYPVSSMNEEDFHHLMDIYLDAVFFPKMLEEENIFKQEGWHKELFDAKDPIKINGVVYNEMRGAFGDADRAVLRAVAERLHPHSTYSHESGGDPYVIPELTYGDFKAFHEKHYRPDNALAFVYGDLDIDRVLAQMDEDYFSQFTVSSEKITLDLPVVDKGTTKDVVYYSGDETMSEQTHSYLTYTVPFGESNNKEDVFVLDILGDALVDAEASPLRHAIVDAGLAEDIFAYPSDGFYQDFGIIVENMDSANADKIVDIIEKTLAEVVAQGIDRDVLEGVMNSREFYYRQAGGDMRGITHGIQMLSVWRYGEPVHAGLEYADSFDIFKERLETTYFESVVEARIVQAKTKQILVHKPKNQLYQAKDEALAKQLAEEKAALTSDVQAALIQENEALRAYQMAPETAEDLATLPQLQLTDVPTETVTIEQEQLNDSPVTFFHLQPSAGVRYVKMAFDMGHVAAADISYVKDLAVLLGSVDTTTQSYQTIDTELMKATAGLSIQPKVYTIDDAPETYHVKMEVSFAAIGDQAQAGFDIVRDVLLNSVFTQKERIFNLLTRVKNDMEQYFEGSGHQAAVSRLRSFYSQPARYAELLNGVAYYDHLTELLADFETGFTALQERFERLNANLWFRNRVTVALTAEAEDKEAFNQQVQDFMGHLTETKETQTQPKSLDLVGAQKEAITTNSNVQYVSQGGPSSAKIFNAKLMILASILSKGYLYDNVRVQGGAYGAGLIAGINGDMVTYSYRDPNIEETFATYEAMIAYLEGLDFDQASVEQFIIGTMSSFHYPLTPSKVNRIMLTRYFKGVTKETIDQRLQDALQTTVEDLKAFAPLLKESLLSGHQVVIGNAQKIEAEAKRFDTVRTLKMKKEAK